MFNEWYKPDACLEFPRGGSQAIVNALVRCAGPDAPTHAVFHAAPQPKGGPVLLCVTAPIRAVVNAALKSGECILYEHHRVSAALRMLQVRC